MGDMTDSAHEQDDQQRWRGERLGLPESGPGSAAPTWRRAVAFLLDLLIAALIAGLFTLPELPRNWSLVAWIVLTVVPVSFTGVTPGMVITGIWVTRTKRRSLVGVVPAVVRCALTALIIPAMVQNQDGRAWHDRLTGTIVLRR